MTREELAAMLYIEAADLLMESSASGSGELLKTIRGALDGYNNKDADARNYYLKALPGCINSINNPTAKKELINEFNKVKAAYKNKDGNEFVRALGNMRNIAANTGRGDARLERKAAPPTNQKYNPKKLASLIAKANQSLSDTGTSASRAPIFKAIGAEINNVPDPVAKRELLQAFAEVKRAFANKDRGALQKALAGLKSHAEWN